MWKEDNELLIEVLAFVHQYPGRRHYVVCIDPEYVGEAIKANQPDNWTGSVELIHPAWALTGWADKAPNCALSCTRVIVDPQSYAQICCRLRNDDAVHHIRGKFSVADFNASVLCSMYPFLFANSYQDSHAYSDIVGCNIRMTNTTVPKIGQQNGNS